MKLTNANAPVHGWSACIGLQPVCENAAFAFCQDGVISRREPVLLARSIQQVRSILRDLDHIFLARALHPRGHVDRIPEQLKPRLLPPQHSRRHRTAVQPEPHPQRRGARPQVRLQPLRQHVELEQAPYRVLRDYYGVIVPLVGQSRHGDVAVSDGLHLEDAQLSRLDVELAVDRLQEAEDLRWLSFRAPRREAFDVRQHHRRILEDLGDGLHLADLCAQVVIVLPARHGMGQEPLELRRGGVHEVRHLGLQPLPPRAGRYRRQLADADRLEVFLVVLLGRVRVRRLGDRNGLSLLIFVSEQIFSHELRI
mmetsp:Transcript_4823/g.10364  ORF Transcript_4823/g.10364 Transcript_4823/m.10364 type:complete len:310 (-) Transcript_4823:367-1296(-)